MITSLIASLLTFLCIVIAKFAIDQRRRSQTAYMSGNGEDKLMQAAVSAHSNFATYTPLYLILSYIMEVTFKLSWLVVLGLGIVFFISRITHFVGLCYKEQADKPNFKFRISAMMMTFATLAIAALINITFSCISIYKNI